MSNQKFIHGDVFLFEAEPRTLSCVSAIIALLTDSDVSHAAMYYGNDSVVEEGLSGIQIRTLKEVEHERMIYVKRYKESPADLPAALFNIGKKYYDAKEPYSISNLFLMGLLLICKRYQINEKVLDVLEALCAELAERIAQNRQPGKKPMTCSQFVAQCYKDANYPLVIREQPTPNAAFGLDTADDGQESLLSMAFAMVDSNELPLSGSDDMNPMAAAPNLGIDTGKILEGLCCTLYKILESNPPKPSSQTGAELPDALKKRLMKVTVDFAVLVQQVSGSGEPAVWPKNAEEAKELLRHMEETYLGFVSPADLLERCPVLEPMGVIRSVSKMYEGSCALQESAIERLVIEPDHTWTFCEVSVRCESGKADFDIQIFENGKQVETMKVRALEKDAHKKVVLELNRASKIEVTGTMSKNGKKTQKTQGCVVAACSYYDWEKF